jgi:hypothetical protein
LGGGRDGAGGSQGNAPSSGGISTGTGATGTGATGTGATGTGATGGGTTGGGTTSGGTTGSGATGSGAFGSEGGSTSAGAAGEGGQGGEGGDVTGTGGAPPTFALVATQHNDDARTGANLSETVLNTTNVRASSFGEVSRRPLRGAVFAQPLVVPDVNIRNKGKFDVLLVATMSNTVYALDARHPEAAPLWVQSFGPSVLLPDAAIPLGTQNLWHEVGIWGTPVVSLSEGAVYVVIATKVGGQYRHTIQKLALESGILLDTADVTATGFDSALSAQRSGLALSGGTLYVPFTSYDSNNGGSGWVFAYDSQLTLLGSVKLGNPDGGGVTMSGQAPVASESGSIYFTTNPSSETPLPVTGSRLLGLKNATPEGLSEILFSTTASTTGTNELGSGGVLMIPGSDRLVSVGQHRTYVVDAAGKLIQQFRPSGSGLCEEISAWCDTTPTPAAFWPGSGASPKPRLFTWSPADSLRSFAFDAQAGRFECTDPDVRCDPLASAAARDSYDNSDTQLMGAAQLSVSSNGTAPGSGIVWAAHAFSRDNSRNPDGILRAFDAENLKQLWSSQETEVRLGALGPAALPTVSGGQAFIGTADGLSNKVTFWDDLISGPPAMTSFGDKYLVLAWGRVTSLPRGFQVKWSADGINFDTSTVVDNFLYYEPALASDGSASVFLGWTASTEIIKVAASDHPSFEHATFMQQRELGGALSPLSFHATTGPALTYGGGRLYLAWNFDNVVHVISSGDGVAFDIATHVTIPNQFSYSPPLLAYLDAKLYLITADFDHRLSLYVSIDNGAHFGDPIPLPMPSGGHPALCVSKRDSSNDPEFQLIWAEAPVGGPTQGIIKAATAPRWDFQAFTRAHDFPEQADVAVSGTRFRDSCYIGWMGVGENSTRPNIARYSPGDLITYGVGGH